MPPKREGVPSFPKERKSGRRAAALVLVGALLAGAIPSEAAQSIKRPKEQGNLSSYYTDRRFTSLQDARKLKNSIESKVNTLEDVARNVASIRNAPKEVSVLLDDLAEANTEGALLASELEQLIDVMERNQISDAIFSVGLGDFKDRNSTFENHYSSVQEKVVNYAINSQAPWLKPIDSPSFKKPPASHGF